MFRKVAQGALVSRPGRSLACALLILGVASKSNEALAEEYFSVDASAMAGAASNPFLTSGLDKEASAFVEFTLAPHFVLKDEKSRTALDGLLRETAYLNHYDGTFEGQVTLTHERELSSRLKGSLLASYETSVLGQREGPQDISVSEPPDTGLDGAQEVLGPDVPLVGFRQRRKRAVASGSLAYDLNERDILTGNVEYSRAHYPDLIDQSNYQSLSGSLRYRHSLSEFSTVGAVLNAERVWYDSDGGKYMIYRPQLTYTKRIAKGWSLELAGGGLVVDGSDLSGSFTVWSWSAFASLCRNDDFSQFCAGFTRDAVASGVSGVRKYIDAHARYSRRLTEDLSVNVNATLSHYGSGSLQDTSSTLWAADGGMQLVLSRRAIARASLGVRRIGYALGGHSSDVYGQGGLSYTLGSLQ